MFFKGYVETNNKESIEKIKGRKKFKTYEQAERLDEFAGILAKDTILVDIDDYEESEILFQIVKDNNLKCRVYQTTRGKHFLFRNEVVTSCKTGCKLAIGIHADIKIGLKNSYEVLKFDNKFRKIIYDEAENEEAEILPKYLLPVNSAMTFLNMKSGDGRNTSLYSYILTLQSNDFSKDEARQTIRLINKYVLNDPLPDDELESVLRDDAFKKPLFYKDKTFLFDKFSVFLKSEYNIIKINNQLHMYKDGIYVGGQEVIEAAMIKHITTLNRARRKETYDYLNLLIRENTSSDDADKIAFRNGIYDITNNTLIEFSPKYIITNKIPWDYNPMAYDELTDRTLNKITCNDKQLRMLLEECIGYCFYRRNNLGKFFIFTGEGSNGKSTFIDMIKTMLGDENTSALELQELGERFKTAELVGKLANVGDDIGDEFVANTSVLKKLATGDRLNVERKGQNPFDFNNHAKLIFSANSIPRMGKGRDNAALKRRMAIIPFNAVFSEDDEDYDPFILYKLTQQLAIEYLIVLGIQGLKRLLKNNKFTTSDKVQQELDDFEEINNPIIGFFKELDINEYLNEPTDKLYTSYQEYCFRDGLEPLKKTNFTKQIKKRYGLEVKVIRVKKKTVRVYVKGAEVN